MCYYNHVKMNASGESRKGKVTDMMMSEFIVRTGFEPSYEEYAEIEEAYYNFDGDKNAFCKAWVKAGEAERINRARLQKIQDLQKAMEDERKELTDRISKLEKQLEKEQEWKPYNDDHAVSDYDYDKLTSFGRKMSDYEAIEWIAQEFGFDSNKIRIYHERSVYEVNRHNQLRKVGTVKRDPVYDATDYYYVYFTVAGWEYEATNGSLKRM